VHRDKARFYEPHAGAGPRSTPTLSGNRLYSLGATGILNAIDRSDGTVIWSRNASTDADVKVPDWGITSSPLVLDTILVVALAGKLAAYDISTGEPIWYGPNGGSGYSSPQLFTLNGVQQVLHMSKTGALSVEPETGKTLWEYPWELDGRILQPSFIEGGDLLVSAENKSIRRISVIKETDGYSIREVWSSTLFKVNFNDFVLNKGFAYGFDGPYLTCIDLRDGKRMWRGDRYRGFQILLADQDLIIVLTEKGEIALVKADPQKFTELARIQALSDKTWSHPVLSDNILFVRNAQEMIAFRLPLTDY
jgi:outer membrane protein assembly factor BamB